MYEQGRPTEHSDLPVYEALGMATHESQSLLWERMVGQSLSFWRWATPIVHRYFPHTKSCTPEDFYRVINIVKPSLIRVDADEVGP
jgi:carboxypeptidase Taq